MRNYLSFLLIFVAHYSLAEPLTSDQAQTFKRKIWTASSAEEAFDAVLAYQARIEADPKYSIEQNALRYDALLRLAEIDNYEIAVKAFDLIKEKKPELLNGLLVNNFKVGLVSNQTNVLSGAIKANSKTVNYIFQNLLTNEQKKTFLRTTRNDGTPMDFWSTLGERSHPQFQNKFDNFLITETLRKFERENHLYTDKSDIVDILKSKPKSLLDFVSRLPADFLKNYAIVFDSKGFESRRGHPATEEKPRVIVFSPDGRLVVTFQEGVDAFEMISFNSNNPKAPVEMYRHEFSNENDVLGPETLNPVSCLNCHKKNEDPSSGPRWNWDSYFVWQGTFLGNDDGRQLDARKIYEHYTRPESEELKGLNLFHDYVDSHPNSVYAKLPDLNKNFPREGRDGQVPGMNSRLTQALAERNVERIAGEIVNQNYYSKYRYLLNWALYCPAPKSSDKLLSQFATKASSLSETVVKNLNATAKVITVDALKNGDYENALSKLTSDNLKNASISKLTETFNKLLLIEKLSGDPILDDGKKIRNWSMQKNSSTVVNRTPFETPRGTYLLELNSFLYELDPVLNAEAHEKGERLDCKTLEERAELQLSKLLDIKSLDSIKAEDSTTSTTVRKIEDAVPGSKNTH